MSSQRKNFDALLKSSGLSINERWYPTPVDKFRNSLILESKKRGH